MADNDINNSHRPFLTVIVAESYPLARAALAALLSYDGYETLQADRLEAALSHIKNTDGPTVLLVDLEMSGWKTIVQHALLKRPGTLVIAMVGNQHLLDIDELKEGGIKVCLLKPIIYKDVRTAITENIEISQNIALDWEQRPRESDVETLRQ